jgi:hypothetical protein
MILRYFFWYIICGLSNGYSLSTPHGPAMKNGSHHNQTSKSAMRYGSNISK